MPYWRAGASFSHKFENFKLCVTISYYEINGNRKRTPLSAFGDATGNRGFP